MSYKTYRFSKPGSLKIGLIDSNYIEQETEYEEFTTDNPQVQYLLEAGVVKTIDGVKSLENYYKKRKEQPRYKANNTAEVLEGVWKGSEETRQYEFEDISKINSLSHGSKENALTPKKLVVFATEKLTYETIDYFEKQLDSFTDSELDEFLELNYLRSVHLENEKIKSSIENYSSRGFKKIKFPKSTNRHAIKH